MLKAYSSAIGQRLRRFYIDTLFDRDFTGTWNSSDEPGNIGRRATARCIAARVNRGLALTSTGRYRLAITETEKALALNTDHTPAYPDRAYNGFMNHLDDALLTRAFVRRTEAESPTSF